MKSEQYCKKIVKDSASNFYYSFFFLKKRKKRAMYAIYAFSRVIDDIVDSEDTLEAKEAKEKMISFWRDEIEKCYSKSSKHPLTEELIYATEEFDIPKEYLLGLLNGVVQDMHQNRYVTFEDLKKYCYGVASVVGLMCLKIFEVKDNKKNQEAAINLGYAFQMTNILRDVGVDADIDRIYLPEEDLNKFGLKEEDIINKRYSDNFKKMMEFEWQRAYDFYQKAWQGFDKDASKKLIAAMIMADIYFEILKRIKESDYNVFPRKIRVLNSQKANFAIKRWYRNRSKK